jgi:DNA-binding transcriptional ArsR family regulator
MVVIGNSSPFGSAARTRVLLALGLLEDSYPRELARILNLPLSGVQRALQGLERDRLVAARSVGRTRLYRLDPGYFAHADLKCYVMRLLEAEDDLRRQVAAVRQRPRRTGKPL